MQRSGGVKLPGGTVIRIQTSGRRADSQERRSRYERREEKHCVVLKCEGFIVDFAHSEGGFVGFFDPKSSQIIWKRPNVDCGPVRIRCEDTNQPICTDECHIIAPETYKKRKIKVANVACSNFRQFPSSNVFKPLVERQHRGENGPPPKRKGIYFSHFLP